MNDQQSIIYKAWDKYIKNKEPIPEEVEGVRKEILDSWRRSQNHSDPFSSQSVFISAEEYRAAMRENSALISIVLPYLQRFYDIFRGKNFQILLADSCGRQLLYLSDDSEIASLSKAAQVKNGLIYSEETNGTNGISLCLIENRPIQVIGAEHYRHMFQSFICYSAPIHASSGEIIGCICIMGSIDNPQRNLMEMLNIATDGIENELRLTLLNSTLETVINLFHKGSILVDSNYRILMHNPHCEEILDLPPEAFDGHLFSELFKIGSLPEHLQTFDHPVLDFETTLFNKDNKPLPLTFSVHQSSQNQRTEDFYLITIETQEARNELTNRMAGYQAHFTFDSIIHESEEMKHVLEISRMIAPTDSNVLIYGESGTGKELLAQSIHNASNRAQGPFIAVNCGSLQKELIESELFGFEGGAFQGANANGNPGKFELAHGGTLFLDEIGSMSLETQTSLLRVLQDKEITRIGGKVAKPIDVRIIAATSVNLIDAMKNHLFRNDLYYRLNVLNINIPPLRERTQDIIPLFKHFVGLYGRKIRSISRDCIQAMMKYDWPGNVRELENITERITYTMTGDIVEISHLPDEIKNAYLFHRYKQTGNIVYQSMVTVHESGLLPPDVQEYNLLLETIKKSHGNVKSASVLLNTPISTLYRKLRKYGINAKDYLYWK